MRTCNDSEGERHSRPSVFLRKYVYTYFLFFAYFIAAAIVLQLFMSEFGFGDAKHSWLNFRRYLEHDAKRPYVYRALTPALTRAVSALVPSGIRYRIEHVETDAPDSALAEKLREVRTIYNWRDTLTVERIVAHGILFLCVLGSLFLLRYITHKVYEYPTLFSDFAPVVASPFLALTFLNCGFIYDFPEILLALACLALLMNSKWLPYYLCFALACINKETAVFTVIYFLAIHAGSMPWKALARHVAMHVGLGSIIIVTIRVMFSGNEGSHAEFHLWQNLRFFSTPSTYFSFTDNYALLIPVPRSFNLLNVALFLPLLFLGWHDKPLWVRRMFIGIMAVLTPLYIIWGVVDEIRVFYLALPAIYLLIIHTVYQCGTLVSEKENRLT